MVASRLSLFGALLAGLLIGALAVGVAWFSQNPADSEGRIVDAGSYDEFVNAGRFPPALFVRDDFFLTTTETGELRALYAYPPFSQVQRRPDCAVRWWEQNPVGSGASVFRDPCFGATFNRDGSWVSGPSSRGLDQFPVTVKDGRILVDTRRLLCDGPGDCRRL
jgi:hypothetical protein